MTAPLQKKNLSYRIFACYVTSQYKFREVVLGSYVLSHLKVPHEHYLFVLGTRTEQARLSQ